MCSVISKDVLPQPKYRVVWLDKNGDQSQNHSENETTATTKNVYSQAGIFEFLVHFARFFHHLPTPPPTHT